MIKNMRGGIMLLITAAIWGTAFVAQSEGMKYVGPFTYTAARMLIGGLMLIPVTLLNKSSSAPTSRGATIKGGICCGTVLFAASSLQQTAISSTTAGKAGFITALYIVIVPVIELAVLHQKTQKRVWFCVLTAIVGFYLLCITDGFGISKGDLLMLACAVFFACHIIVIDYFIGKNTDGIMMSCIQFFVSGILASVMMLLFEHPQIGSIIDAKITILYAGVLSSGVAYTLQILGQRYTEPTVSTLIMSLESVFAAISGWIILGERLSLKEGAGCLLVFISVILAQLKIPGKNSDDINIYE